MSGRIMDPRARVSENKFDAEAWAQLVREAQSRVPANGVQELRDVYEEILRIFPTSASYWKAYGEMELAANNVSEVKSVFARCLKGKCQHIDLWRSYIAFMKKMHSSQGNEQDVIQVQRAYDYTLDQIGQDMAAGVIWQEYIAFLKMAKPGSVAYTALFGGGAAGQEEAKRTVALRRVYHRALVVPTNSLENLWRSYEAFEKDASKQLAAPMLAEYKHKYQGAKTVLQERKKLLEGIKWGAMALPLGCRSAEMEEQAVLWTRYLEFESSNPQQLDRAALQARVTLAYDQALMFMYHVPDFWFSAAVWHVNDPLGGGAQQAALIFSRARAAIPGCSMLRFAAADVEEQAARKAKEDGEELEVTRHQEAAECVYKELVGEGEDPTDALEDAEGRALAWILYMRFARRSVGVKHSRDVFGRARRWESCPWQVWAGSAMMEWERSHEEKVARNIFEAGLKKFMSKPEYIAAYADFMVGMGDATNVRTLYERALQNTTDIGALTKLWDAFLEFEYKFGTLEAYEALEARRREACKATEEAEGLPALAPMSLMGLKYRAFGLWPAAGEVKEYMAAKLGGQPWSAAPALALSPALGGASAAAAASPREQPDSKTQPDLQARAPQLGQLQQGNGDAARGRTPPLPPSDGRLSPRPGGLPDQRLPQARGGDQHPGARRESPVPLVPVPRLSSMRPRNPNEPLKQLPEALGLFITALPQGPVEGKVPPADLVLDILRGCDLDALMASAIAEQQQQQLLQQQQQGDQAAAAAASQNDGAEGARTRGGGKRRNDATDAPQADNRPPAFDIYRQRRRQKLAGGAP